METPLPELELGQSHEFTTLWMVFGGYEVTGGVLRRSRDDTVAVYPPIRRRELPGEIAKLRRGDEAGIVRFAAHYGQLGYDQLVSSGERRGGIPLTGLGPTRKPSESVCI
jgi:hypothetical protein